MTKKEIRKWMRQYVLRELSENSESRGEDLLNVEKGSITKISDLLAIGLRDYIKATSYGVVGIDVSGLALSEFKREFIDTDEDIKTTLLYGFITQKNIPFKDEGDYVLGKEREGGFKMVDLNLEKINQEDVVDLTDEFQEYISNSEEEEEENIRFSEGTKDVTSFIVRASENKFKNTKKAQRMVVGIKRGGKGGKGGNRKGRKKGSKSKVKGKPRLGARGPRPNARGPRPNARGPRPNARGPRPNARGTRANKGTGGTKAGKVGASLGKKGYIVYPNKKALEKSLDKLSPKARESMMARIVQVGDAYEVKMITASDILADYEALDSELQGAQEAYEKDPSEANWAKVEVAVEAMQSHKAEVLKIWMSYGNLHRKGSFASKLEGKKRENIKMVYKARVNIIKAYYGDRAKSRDLVFDEKGRVFKVLNRAKKDTKTKKKNEITRKKEIPREWMKRQHADKMMRKKIREEKTKKAKKG